VPARLGAVEQVTVETAGLGGDDGVTGGVNLKFVTRRGTNKCQGSFFEQYRTDKLNANTFGNIARDLPKPELRRHDFGGNFGGPLVPSKLFGFVNYEVEYIPQSANQTNTILTEAARTGNLPVPDGWRRGRSRSTSTSWQAQLGSSQLPIQRSVLCSPSSHRPVHTAAPSRVQPPHRNATWLEPQKTVNYYPTVRVDYQVKTTCRS
jgi:hypothetical protein